MRVVVALGGNALLHRGGPADADTQRHNVTVAARAVAELAADHQLVVTHGNGPQIGLAGMQLVVSDAHTGLSLDPPIRGCGWWFLDAAQGVGGGRSRWVTRSRMSGG